MRIIKDKKEDKIIFSFGTSKSEQRTMKYVWVFANKLEKAVNKAHQIVNKIEMER